MDIFLLRLDRVGDFVLGIPAYRALKRAHPRDRIMAVVSPLVKDLAETCPYFDEVFLFEAVWLQPGRGLSRRWASARRLISFLRSKKPDMVVDFRYQSRLDAFVTGFSGASKRVGFDLGFPASLFLTHKSSPPPGNLHQVERNLHLLRKMGIEDPDLHLEMWVNARDRKTAEEHMPRQENLPGIPRVAVHIGAATPSKQWKADDFSTLVQELEAQFQAQVALLGGVDDVQTAKDVTEGLKGPVTDLVGHLDLRQTAALLKTCDLFIGGDSGLGHLAAACGTPVVSLFSAANEPEVWRPWGEKVRVLTVKPDCAPCKSHTCTRTDGYFCMDEIRVDQVLDAVKGFLKPA